MMQQPPWVPDDYEWLLFHTDDVSVTTADHLCDHGVTTHVMLVLENHDLGAAMGIPLDPATAARLSQFVGELADAYGGDPDDADVIEEDR